MTEIFAVPLQHSTTSQLECICIICCAEAFTPPLHMSFTLYFTQVQGYSFSPTKRPYKAVRAKQISRDVSAGSVKNPAPTAVTP